MINNHVNKVILVGQVTGGDLMPRLNGKQSLVTNFEIKTELRKRTGSGQVVSESEFHSIVAWGDLARVCMTSLREGSLVYLEGRLRSVSRIENQGRQKQNSSHKFYQIIAEQIRPLDQNGSSSFPGQDPETVKGSAQKKREEITEEAEAEEEVSFLFSDEPLVPERTR